MYSCVAIEEMCYDFESDSDYHALFLPVGFHTRLTRVQRLLVRSSRGEVL